MASTVTCDAMWLQRVGDIQESCDENKYSLLMHGIKIESLEHIVLYIQQMQQKYLIKPFQLQGLTTRQVAMVRMRGLVY